MYLGSFLVEGQAARAHDIMSIKAKGLDGGQLNFLQSDYKVLVQVLPLVSKVRGCGWWGG